jgi:hypothetical protein
MLQVSNIAAPPEYQILRAGTGARAVGLGWRLQSGSQQMEKGRGVHDMGGLEAGPIDRESQHAFEWWEKRVDAMLVLLSGKDRKLITVDELRRGIEELGPGAYENMSYYERWIHSITHALLEKGILSSDELGRKMAEVESRADGSA